MSAISNQIKDMWAYIECELPDNLTASAFKTGAIIRYKGFKTASDLLRIILTYAVTDMSLKTTAAWAYAINLAQVTHPALYYRVRDARDWLSELIASMLNTEVKSLAKTDLKITLVDATVLTGPGSKGTDWRLHTGVDPHTGHINSIKLSDSSIGETYQNYPISPQEVLVGDRAYSLATGISYVHKKGGYVVVRANLHSIRLCLTDKKVFNPLLDEAKIPKTGVVHYDILIPAPPEIKTRSHKPWPLEAATDWIPARLLAVRTIKDTIIWIITTVPESFASDEMIMELYRVRWQIELEFKRLKSLLDLDRLPTRNGPTAESWILARILAAILIEQILRKSGVFSPWGYRLCPAVGK